MTRWLLLMLLLPTISLAYRNTPSQENAAANTEHPMNSKMGFDQKLGAQVPGELTFRDENGKTVKLGDFYGKQPIVLAMVYYGCPNLCGMVINGLFKALEQLPFNPNDKFRAVLVSIDPTETGALATKKKKNYLAKYKRPGAEEGIHFLTGDEANVRKLADTIGFRYAYDDKTKQYAHPAGVTVLTNEGTVSRYLYGIEYAGKDLRLALVEASQNKIGSVVDKFLLYCYHYDPVMGTYAMTAMYLLRVAAVVTVLLLAGGIIYMLVNEKRRRAA